MFYDIASEWLVFNAKWAICQQYHGENTLYFNEMIMMFALYYINTLGWIYIVLAVSLNLSFSLKQQSVGRHVTPLSTLSWFRANQSFLVLLNAVCLAEEQQIPISIVFSLNSPWLKLTDLPHSGEHANHYTTDGVKE